MQADGIAEQQRLQYHLFEHLANAEHHEHPDQLEGIARLHQHGDAGYQQPADHAHIRHETHQPRAETDHQRQVQAGQPQAHDINRAQHRHHQQLAADELAQDLVGLLR